MFIDQASPKLPLPGGSEPCPDAILEQVGQICAAPDFAHSERLKRFLRFIVGETLAGRGDRLKAYAIALSVFERDESFDPQADPIVRIEAGRLRRALEHYYLTSGLQDPIVITVPKGSYLPHFTLRTPVTAGSAANAGDHNEEAIRPASSVRRYAGLAAVAVALGAALLAWIFGFPAPRTLFSAKADPVILVIPFLPAGEPSEANLVASGLTGAMIDTLVSEQGLRVMGRETTRWAQSGTSFAVLRDDYGLTHVLEGDVIAQGGKVTISARLVEARTHAILWARRYERSQSVALADVEADIADSVLAKLVGRQRDPASTVVRSDVVAAGKWDDYSCKLRFYQYRADMTVETHAGVRRCLEEAIGRTPKDSAAWAMLSLILIDDLRGAAGEVSDRKAVLARAREAAAMAVGLAPGDARALEAHALALYFAGKPTEGRAAADQAMAASPNDPELLGEVGPRIAQAGEWELGRKLLMQATALNPGHAGYYAGHLAFIAYMQGDVAAAAQFIDRTNANQFATRALVEALIAAELGDTARAARARDRFMAVAPGFVGRLDEEIASRNMMPADARKLRNGIAKAGF